jgi:hypothetical protein
MAQQVLEGTWEEVQVRAAELTGRRVTVIVTEEPAPTPAQSEATFPPVDEKQAAAIAYFQARLEAAQNASPEELERGKQEVAELMRNLNENRIAAGELPILTE